MALYQVEIVIRLETYAHTTDEAIRQAQQAIKIDTRIAAPEPGVPVFGAAIAIIDPDRQHSSSTPPRNES